MKRSKQTTKKRSGLRRRWVQNTFCVILALGMVCVLAVTASFAAYYYSNMESDMRYRAKTTTDFFADYLDQNYSDFYQSCMTYAQTFEDRNRIELQFINRQGRIVASSYGNWAGLPPQTSEIQEAINTRSIRSFVGKDPATGERIIAVSSPMIYSNGEVIGVLRYVTATRLVNRQIFYVSLVSFGVLAVVLAAVIFSGQLSHELRTPLTAITGWSETLLADDTLDPQTRQGMKIISREAKRLTEMVVDLLDFTRMQDGRMTLSVEPTDIRSEFEETVYMYGSRLEQEGIRLEYLENDDDIPVIPCDGKRLRQVFLNILDNAAKHGGSGKRIEASMTCENGQVVVRIRDYGPGIPPDEIPLVKKKFYKGSSSVRGTGIGLAVSDEIVEMHGGTLTLENAPGGGTLVTVRLPVSQ